MTDRDPRVELVARATHAHNNSGVHVAGSPLTWETEPPAIRDWHRAMAAAAVAALDDDAYEPVGARYRYLWKEGPGPWIASWDGNALPHVGDVEQECEPVYRKVEP